MIRFKIYLLVFFVLASLSCERDNSINEITDMHYETIKSLSQNDLSSLIANANPVYPDLTIPQNLIDLWKNGHKTPLKSWINGLRNRLEKECRGAEECTEIKEFINKLIYIDRQLDVHFDAKELYESELQSMEYCGYDMGCVYDNYVVISPGSKTIQVGESATFDYEIFIGGKPCIGEVEWGIDERSVATVDQNGKVTGILSGTAQLIAVSKDFGIEIQGFA